MPRRKGWDFAQLSATFPGDPEFVRLSRRAADDRTYLAAVGLWVIALADAWHSDNPVVSDVLEGFEEPDLEALLARAGLVRDGEIVGFGKWTEAVRRQREEDAARKRAGRQTLPESNGVPRSDRDSSRGVGEELVVGVVEKIRSTGSPTVKVERRPDREPLLTKAQLDAWIGFGPEWASFKDAWLRRGFMWPPYGSPDDDDTSQRGLLWSLLDSRPRDTVQWVIEAPGITANEVIGYILGNWHAIREEAEPTLPIVVVNGANRREAPELIGNVMRRLAEPA